MKKLALELTKWVLSISCVFVALFGCKSESEDSGASSKVPLSGGAITFSSVQGILTKNCVSCHGENGKEGIDLRTYDSVMKGGEHGPIVVAGDASGSALVQSLHGMNGKKQMPMNAKPLSADDSRKIEDWIAAGAKA